MLLLALSFLVFVIITRPEIDSCVFVVEGGVNFLINSIFLLAWLVVGGIGRFCERF